jgi:hypothetical protein
MRNRTKVSKIVNPLIPQCTIDEIDRQAKATNPGLRRRQDGNGWSIDAMIYADTE